MTSTTGGEAIVNGLVAHGVDTVFGLPGAQIYGLFDAFQQAQLKVIGARHEQACGYMAYGYARSTGRPGVFSVVPGPGVLNAGAALLTAFGANEPVLCLTGQVPTQFLGKGRGHLHEMPDQLATLRSFVKWADRIEYPDAAPTLVSRAFQEMLSGRRGPVALEMPWDVFTQRAETGPAKIFDPFPAPQPDSDRDLRGFDFKPVPRRGPWESASSTPADQAPQGLGGEGHLRGGTNNRRDNCATAHTRRGRATRSLSFRDQGPRPRQRRGCGTRRPCGLRTLRGRLFLRADAGTEDRLDPDARTQGDLQRTRKDQTATWSHRLARHFSCPIPGCRRRRAYNKC